MLYAYTDGVHEVVTATVQKALRDGVFFASVVGAETSGDGYPKELDTEPTPAKWVVLVAV